MSYGCVFCFSNEAMPGILKIGMTNEKIETYLHKLNTCYDEWKPPTPYNIEIAKYVYCPEKKLASITKFLDNIVTITGLPKSIKEVNISMGNNFFKVSISEISNLFEVMDGDLWEKNESDSEEESEEEIEEEIEEDDNIDSLVKYCFDLIGKTHYIREININDYKIEEEIEEDNDRMLKYCLSLIGKTHCIRKKII